MEPAVLLVATQRDQVIYIRYVVTVGLCKLTIIPYEASDAATVPVDRLIELIQRR
jgi:hypothetical protein